MKLPFALAVADFSYDFSLAAAFDARSQIFARPLRIGPASSSRLRDAVDVASI